MRRIVMKKFVNDNYPDGVFMPIEWKDIKKGDVLQFWEDATTIALPNGVTQATALGDAKFSGTNWGVDIEYSVIVEATMERIV